MKAKSLICILWIVMSAIVAHCQSFDLLKSKIDSIVELNIAAKSFPGCQIVVATHDSIIFQKSYGATDYGVSAKSVNDSTLYDLASLTKVVATLPAIMKAHSNSMLRVDDTLSLTLNKITHRGLIDLTLSDFLVHRTGLPAGININSIVIDTASYAGRLITYRPTDNNIIEIERGSFWNKNAQLKNKHFSTQKSQEYRFKVAKKLFTDSYIIDKIDSAVYNAPVGARKYVYSDLNFAILKDYIETLTQHPIQEWLADSVFIPLGMRHTVYTPIHNGYKAEDIAPTEFDNYLRHQHLQGYVHDELAAFTGGINGNAGLFSTASDVAKLCQCLLNDGKYGDTQIFDTPTVEIFTQSTSSDGMRGLGFDRAARLSSVMATGVSESTIGHTGYTGTCLWIDPENDIAFVMLCNRVDPSRTNNSFARLSPRTAILKAVMDCLFHKNEVDSSN